jgi:hypothetical protein
MTKSEAAKITGGHLAETFLLLLATAARLLAKIEE